MDHNFTESNNHDDGHIVRNVEITTANYSQEANGNSAENSSVSFDEETESSSPGELDLNTWEPPDPENSQDDMDDSVTFNDDDEDEDTVGMKWGESTSLSHGKDVISGTSRFKEEKQRAAEEVTKGKFKAIVSQLLKSVGVSCSCENGESWVDIITSLSWEAASFLKPDAIDGNAMDPDGRVKVKCIATGSRSESKLVKGLIFKKHAAHKHMPTKCKSPRLLLLKGILGHSSKGLSSFDTIKQEDGYLKSVFELIESCSPNVILVEKTVSRDIQESIQEKGMTLVLDTKLHRLERVARCTGSPILSCDDLNYRNLKQCDFIYFEKFVEEHASLGEGGKRPTKTLMFIEGCPTRVGCTILLKGTHSDELKRIKCVLRCAVIMAYHLILETSFVADQKSMFSTIPSAKIAKEAECFPTDQQTLNLESSNSKVPSPEESTADTESLTIDIPISSGVHDGCSDSLKLESEANSPFCYVPYNPVIFTGFSSLSSSSSSLKKVIGDSFPFTSSAPYQSLSAYFGFNGEEPNSQIREEVSQADENSRIEAQNNSDQKKSLNGGPSQPSSVFSEAHMEKRKVSGSIEEQTKTKDNINPLLDSQSILVLMSSRNSLKGTMCEQSRFSHIMFYRNFDIPLGKFLRDNLLNQRRNCTSCGKLPEAHIYYYAHNNKQLTINVRQLPKEKHLPGEACGKLWMWSHCSKCETDSGLTSSTKRVLISTAALCLSFGKFLELSFTHYSSSIRKSSCGHSLDRDFLHFFGLGTMVAMFRYTSVATYTVSVPPHKLDFSNSIRKELLSKEFENVHKKGSLLFSEVKSCLKTVKAKFTVATVSPGGSRKEFLDVEEILQKEEYDFEVNVKNAAANNGNPDQAAYKLLSLNRVLVELLVESCIWDRRLYSLHSRDPTRVDSTVAEKVLQEQLHPNAEGTSNIVTENSDLIFDCGDYTGANVKHTLDISVEEKDFQTKEIPIRGPVQERNNQDDFLDISNVAENLIPKRSSVQELNFEGDLSVSSGDVNFKAENFVFSDGLQVNGNIPYSTDNGNSEQIADTKLFKKSASMETLVSNLQNANEWFWMPFSSIREIGIREIQKNYLPNFESVCGYTPEYLPTAHQLITKDGTRLHIPLGTDHHIISDYEGELSSIIACALSMLKDSPVVTEILDENSKRGRGMAVKTTESSHSLSFSETITFPHSSSSGSLNLDSVHSTGSFFSEESRISHAPEYHSVEVPLGFAKSLGREKYSVICQYFNQFRELRNLCCSSELDYIASLSRCRNWDAKGGKSKSYFAKTLDDRFIIKEIKKTEFDSFLGFASLYFKYMKESFEAGSQTCLAKIMGIYQVTRRQIKGGKAVKHDLMVMENLTYNWNITRQYDLKGALHARYNSNNDGSGDVLLDQNFVNDMNSSPLYVSITAKSLLQRAIWNDTSFLNSINVMDYSLLVGVDSQRRELVCGIIDYLRQYTWDKQLETWIKSSLVPKNVLPTVISPKDYKKRFRKFLSTHFLSVPDHWCLCSNAQ
ncbi:1-phosphatidylinositol-3-phosphate 5-kinase [Quillaja saponaria]|uniref:1-phosphatidylinositol-3-phosphate 5-kinase n=1 Tax=Quillaja saponaria TaxID=32244 RepID=A0AAD7Q3H2_QUISA|nr:1-phosphatidylinositol-3-phosphate 5-kinase [Quillaja saponaria]